MSLVGAGQTAQVAVMAQRAKNAWVANLAPEINPNAQLRKVRVAVVAPDARGLPAVERLPSGAYYQADNLGTVAGTGGAASAPGVYAVSHAVSLQSAFPGATGRGRFYLPHPSRAVQGNGKYLVSEGGLRCTNARLFIQALNLDAAAIGFGQVVIASGGSVPRALPPDLHAVATVRVGLRPDVIRSRSNAITEDYVDQVVVG
jgi:hypothetical protein